MWSNAMIDVECFAMEEDAALVGLGAVFFDIETCTLGPTFSGQIHLATSVALGGKLEASTILWWLGQSEAVRNQVRFGSRDVRLVLTDFCEWMREHSDPKTVLAWGNSDAFDLSKVEKHLKWLGLDTPWYWTNRRCFRTTRNQYKQVEYDPSQKNGEAHDPLVDAVFQAEHLFKIKNRNKK
jgi:hypothetical protein